MPNSPVVLKEPEGSDDYMEVTNDKEQCLSDHYTAPVTPPAYTPSILFLGTMEHADTLLMGDEVIGTIHVRETNKFIKSSVDDIVLIPKEFEVTSDSDLECDMPTTTPLPPTNNREEDFDINSPLGEQVVDFLMENMDVAGLPRHLVKQLFNHLIKNPSLTKGMSDKPLGDDSKLRSYDVTFSNPLFETQGLPRLEDFVPKSRRCRRLRRCEQVGIFSLELVLTFPRVFWTSTCIPTDFNDRYTASLELLDLSVHNLYWFFNEIEFVVKLDFLQGYNECVIG
ncbi:hypothetical protein Tco_0324803 [Tanacetum coccineum]